MTTGAARRPTFAENTSEESMKRIVLKSGLISGAILAVLFSVSMTLCLNGVINFDNAEVIGYTSMVLAFLMVFFGIRSYRDSIAGGTITFGRAFKVGILITLVACAVYVIGWEITYWGFIPDFDERYVAYMLEKLRAGGASDAEIAKKTADMAKFRELYANPLFNAAITFLEIFPVGLVVTLVSAALLRRREPRLDPVTA
jgi:Protein of unknown function (DUF4199)